MNYLSKLMNKATCIVTTLSLILTSFCAASEYVDAASATICSFSFSISDGPATAKDLNDTYNTKADRGYNAISGALSSDSVLYASVANPEAKDYKKLEWSKASEYSFNNSAQPATPIIAASSNNRWGTTPFFLIRTSSKGYESLNISFRIGASKKGPKNYKVQYSTNGSSFTDITGSEFSLATNKTLYNQSFNLPSAANNIPSLYIRIIATSTATVEGGSTTSDSKGGEIAINNVTFAGTAAKAAAKPTVKPTVKPGVTSKPGSAAQSQQSAGNSASVSNPGTDSNTSGTAQNNTTRKIRPLKLTSYKRRSKTIKGRSLKGSTIHATVGSKAYTCKVSKKGTFKIKLTRKLKKGTTIKIYATKSGCTQSKTKSYVVR